MIEVKREGIILNKTTLELENEGVLNPAAIREGDSVHLFYRAVCKKEIIPVSLMARLTIEKYKVPERKPCSQPLARKAVNDANYINKYVIL